MNGQKTKTSFFGVFLLVLTALIWGTSFISQSEGSKIVQPFTFNGIRTLLGTAVLLPVIFIRDRAFLKNADAAEKIEFKKKNRKTIFCGMIMGIAFCLATNLQQFAFENPNHSAGKIAFITAMYMFLVPIFGLFFKKKVAPLTWLCVVVATAGLYLLCIDENGPGSVTKSDILSLICAVFFSVQILMIEKFAPDCDGIKLSCVQFLFSGVITVILMFIFEKPEISSLKECAFPLLYSGVMSCGVAYTLQIVGQKHCEATLASMIMCLESVFAAVFEAVFSALFMLGGKVLSPREMAGCAVMFAAIVFSQISEMRMNKSEK